MAAAAVAYPSHRTSVMMDTRMHARTPSPPMQGPDVEHGDSTPNPENAGDKSEGLSAEIQMLSTKLVNAINYNTNIDDTLQSTRQELDQARQELARVRAEKRSLDDAITRGVLVKKSEVDKTIASIRAQMAQERVEREKAEKAKKETEGELENLTSALFEEANTMVAAARKDTEAVERRNSQLRSQLQDNRELLSSQQEQLQDLKITMGKLDMMDASREGSMPSTPITGPGGGFESAIPASPSKAGTQDVEPSHPLHFSTLLAPMLRNDTSAYADFSELLVSARRAQPHSRNASGNHSSANLSSANPTAMASSPSLPGAFSFGGASSANSSPSSSGFNAFTAPPLKETKFYKRILTEDLEPTLRLDLAPGLSFLSRRTVNSSLLNGSLVVEPFAPAHKFYSPIFACALCGESRKTEPYSRRYRFRTSESEDAQRYPLCEYCLGRVRTSCDFVGFLRMVRDGHWRCDSELEEKRAWEEAVKLRERMFWARLGGGVVPKGQVPMAGAAAAMRGSLESVPERAEVTGKKPPPISREDAATPELQMAPEVEDEGEGSQGIGRALVNMSSRAASSAMPELKPQTPDPAPDEDVPMNSQQAQEAATAQLHLETDGARPPLNKVEEFQAPASASEDVSTPPAEMALEQFQTPTESPALSPVKPSSRPSSPLKTLSRSASPVKTSLEVKRASSPVLHSRHSSTATSRPSSPLKTGVDERRLSTPARSTSPFKRPGSPAKPVAEPSAVEEKRSSSRMSERSLSRPGRSELTPAEPENERRPSSSASNVLARVRAMEGRG